MKDSTRSGLTKHLRACAEAWAREAQDLVDEVQLPRPAGAEQDEGAMHVKKLFEQVCVHIVYYIVHTHICTW